jgi:hypothetical protein
MSDFELVEIVFDSDDFSSTLEDEFLTAKITRELEAVTDIEQLRLGALKLLQIAMMRQSVIRGLCKRISKLEVDTIRTRYTE